MDLTEREKSLIESLKKTAGSALAHYIPVLGSALVGYEAYKQSVFNRNVTKVLETLSDKLKDIETIKALFSDEWLETEDGKQFSNKVIDCALDAQIEEKQQLFITALINGIRSKDLTQLEKLKFIDILRQLSLSALHVLADIHPIYSQGEKPPLISIVNVVGLLGEKYGEPFLVEAALNELRSAGLFSPSVAYVKLPDGKHSPSGRYPEDTIVYSNFTRKFVNFIETEQLP